MGSRPEYAPVVLETTIYPAIVLTYYGTSAPLLEQIRVVGQEDVAKSSSSVVDAQTVLVTSDEIASTVPIDYQQVETSYICAKDDETRSIVVEVDSKKNHFACRVIYRSDLARKVAWQDLNDQSS